MKVTVSPMFGAKHRRVRSLWATMSIRTSSPDVVSSATSRDTVSSVGSEAAASMVIRARGDHSIVNGAGNSSSPSLHAALCWLFAANSRAMSLHSAGVRGTWISTWPPITCATSTSPTATGDGRHRRSVIRICRIPNVCSNVDIRSRAPTNRREVQTESEQRQRERRHGRRPDRARRRRSEECPEPLDRPGRQLHLSRPRLRPARAWKALGPGTHGPTSSSFASRGHELTH